MTTFSNNFGIDPNRLPSMLGGGQAMSPQAQWLISQYNQMNPRLSFSPQTYQNAIAGGRPDLAYMLAAQGGQGFRDAAGIGPNDVNNSFYNQGGATARYTPQNIAALQQFGASLGGQNSQMATGSGLAAAVNAIGKQGDMQGNLQKMAVAGGMPPATPPGATSSQGPSVAPAGVGGGPQPPLTPTLQPGNVPPASTSPNNAPSTGAGGQPPIPPGGSPFTPGLPNVPPAGASTDDGLRGSPLGGPRFPPPVPANIGPQPSLAQAYQNYLNGGGAQLPLFHYTPGAPSMPSFNASAMVQAQRAANGYGNVIQPYGGRPGQPTPINQTPNATLAYSGFFG